MQREFEGIASLGITTGPYLKDPEAGFSTINWLNQHGYDLSLELYPFHTPRILSKMGSLIGGGNGKLPIPAAVDPQVLEDWKLFYPDARVTQLHLPFAYDFSQAVHWAAFLGKDSPLSNIHHLAHMVCFGWATDGRVERVVEAIGNPDLVLNVHPEVAWKALAKGKLDRLTGLGKVAIEDTTNPPLTFKILAENELDLGFTLGLDHPDHLETVGLSVAKVLKDEGVRRHTTAIHLAGPSHGKLSSHDLAARGILEELAATPFDHPVTAYLDLHPSTLVGMNIQEELEFWQRQLDFIKSTQPQLD